MNLTPWLEDIERRINPEEETAIYDAWKRFALGQQPEGVPFAPPCRTPVKTELEWKHININDAVAGGRGSDDPFSAGTMPCGALRQW